LERTASDRSEAGEIREQKQGDKRKQSPLEKENMDKRDRNKAAEPGEVGEPAHKKQKNTSSKLGKSIESRIETKAEKRFRESGRLGTPKSETKTTPGTAEEKTPPSPPSKSRFDRSPKDSETSYSEKDDQPNDPGREKAEGSDTSGSISTPSCSSDEEGPNEKEVNVSPRRET
jgi:hypothetical protein